MTDLDEEIRRGGDAKRLLENPIFQDAIKAVREGVVGAMAKSGMGDEKAHNRLVIALQLLTQIEAQIKTVMQTGQMAEIQVKDGLGKTFKRVLGV